MVPPRLRRLQAARALPRDPRGAKRARCEGQERLVAEAQQGIAHRRLPRVDGAGRAPTGRAQCRSCRAPIDKGAWRIALVFYEEGRFEPSGFVHAGCAQAYFETTDILPRVRRFSPELREEDLAELQADLGRPRAPEA